MTQRSERYVVAGSRPWNREVFDRRLRHLPGQWEFVATTEELEQALASPPAPAFIFFLHWSSIVAERIHTEHPCVVFHMTDVPYGRGGSPLQNLIVRGHRDTVVSAIQMTSEVDGGPVLAKGPLDLQGTAEEIYRRADEVSAGLLEQIVRDRPEAVPQNGVVTKFERRRPADSELPTDAEEIAVVYDRIRMLDAQGYPHAFVQHGTLRIELREARIDGNEVFASAHLRVLGPEEDG